MRKGIISTVLLLALVVSIVGCGDKKKVIKDEKTSIQEGVTDETESASEISTTNEKTDLNISENVADDMQTSEETTTVSRSEVETTTVRKVETETTTKKQQGSQKYTFKNVSDGVHFYSTKKDAVKVYDQPSSSGKVVDTFGLKHLMYVESVCKETGWYKIIYDDVICSEKNVDNHLYVEYTGEPKKNRIILTKEAKNLKTAYINPNDVVNTHGYEYEVYHKWNDLEMPDYYSWTQQSMNFYKKLCYAPRFTVVEHEKDEHITYNLIGMFVPKCEDDDKGMEIIQKYLDEKGAYLDDYSISGIGTRPSVRFIRVEYLDKSEQSFKLWNGSYLDNAEINWNYFEKVYGYSEEEAAERCEAYVGSIYWDQSIGKIDTTDGEHIILNMDELYQICKLADKHTLEVLKRPSLKRYEIEEVIYDEPNEAGQMHCVYYMYTSQTTSEMIAKLEEELGVYKELWADNFYEEKTEFVSKTQEGLDVYVKKCYFTY